MARQTWVKWCTCFVVALCTSCRNHESGRARATAALTAFLQASLVTSAISVPDSLSACDIEAPAEYGWALAGFRLLDVKVYGDSAIGRVEVTSVAKEQQDTFADRYVAVEGVARDTLEWTLLRRSHRGSWGVCGYGNSEVDFISLRPDTIVRWQPSGASVATALKLADSIAGVSIPK